MRLDWEAPFYLQATLVYFNSNSIIIDDLSLLTHSCKTETVLSNLSVIVSSKGKALGKESVTTEKLPLGDHSGVKGSIIGYNRKYIHQLAYFLQSDFGMEF